jgi:hypothetical protein
VLNGLDMELNTPPVSVEGTNKWSKTATSSSWCAQGQMYLQLSTKLYDVILRGGACGAVG